MGEVGRVSEMYKPSGQNILLRGLEKSGFAFILIFYLTNREHILFI